MKIKEIIMDILFVIIFGIMVLWYQEIGKINNIRILIKMNMTLLMLWYKLKKEKYQTRNIIIIHI